MSLMDHGEKILPMGCEAIGASRTEPPSTRSGRSYSGKERVIQVSGIHSPVEVLFDNWGVPHIYAQCTEDLFFAQGFVAARDRLYQMEIWRRTRRGELSEIFGSSFVERDRIARLTKYRGPSAEEWDSYSPGTRLIVESFVRGINTYIDTCADNLPLEIGRAHV